MSNNTTAPLQSSNSQQKIVPSSAPAPAFLQKKGLLGAASRKGAVGMGSIVSPTDNTLSPCSAKLSSAKQRHFQKGKPVHLASQLSLLASSNSNSSLSSAAGNQPKSAIDF
ncbi:hypothetical protein P7C73_g3348, partial [Tremellales sp. Uapishka_1]